jgi:hypothetical protein
MLGEPVLELRVALKDELQGLTDYVIELVRAEELGIALGSLGKGLVDPQVQPALRELWVRRLKQWHGCTPLHLRGKNELALEGSTSWPGATPEAPEGI